MQVFNFDQLEDAIRTAMKLSDVKTKTVAIGIGMSESGLNSFKSGKTHVSAATGNKIIDWFKVNDPDALAKGFMLLG